MDIKLVKGPSVYIGTSTGVTNRYKIGFTKDIKQRMRLYHTDLLGEDKVVHIQYFESNEAMMLAEKLVHYLLRNYRDRFDKEWFITSNIDYFIITLNKVADFINEDVMEVDDCSYCVFAPKCIQSIFNTRLK